MAWRVILAVTMLILLTEHFTTVAQEYFRVWNTPSKDICERSSTRSGFFRRDSYYVLFNRTSRLIVNRMRYYNPYKTNTIFDDVKWKWNDTELGIGVYVSFLHGNAEIRKNDNPPTNPVQLQKSFREDLPDTGSGSDFSAFYKGDPLFPQSRFNYEDTKEVVRRLSGTKCAQTEAWVANEGFYKWDYETNEWTPIYYMPWNTDFYY